MTPAIGRRCSLSSGNNGTPTPELPKNKCAQLDGRYHLIGLLIKEPSAGGAPLESLCLPPDADNGEPVDADVHEAWLIKYRDQTKLSGWILREVTVSSDSLKKPTGKDWDLNGSRPDLVCVLRSDDGDRQTSTIQNATSVQTNPYWFVERDREVTFEIRDKDLAGDYNSMGSFEFRPHSGRQEVNRPMFCVKMHWIEAHF